MRINAVKYTFWEHMVLFLSVPLWWWTGASGSSERMLDAEATLQYARETALNMTEVASCPGIRVPLRSGLIHV